MWLTFFLPNKLGSCDSLHFGLDKTQEGDLYSQLRSPPKSSVNYWGLHFCLFSNESYLKDVNYHTGTNEKQQIFIVRF